MNAKILLIATLLSLGTSGMALASDVDQSIADLEKTVKSDSKNWTAHAKLSYLQWQSGNVTDAVVEGQKAIFAAPGNPLPLVNLAHIYQGVGEYDYAIPLYEKARKSAPTDWVAWVSLARCYFGKDQLAPGLDVLNQMAAKSSDDFAWNYQLGLSFLTVDRWESAIAPLEKAFKIAPTNEQKTAAIGDLIVALLRDGKTDVAKNYLSDFFKSGSSNAEAFVRVAAAFPSATVFDTAVSNLAGTSASDAFYRMGRVFESKGEFSLAQKAFAHSLELNPGAARSHEALAANLDKQGKHDEAIASLEQAAMFDANDVLAKFLLAHRDKTLTAVNFEAKGLTCGCQTGRVDAGFAKQNAVALISFEHKAPYRGVLLVDPAETTVDAAFDACTHSVFPAGGESVPVGFKFEASSKVDLSSINTVINLAHAAEFGDPLEYHRKFDPIQPTLVADVDRSAL